MTGISSASRASAHPFSTLQTEKVRTSASRLASSSSITAIGKQPWTISYVQKTSGYAPSNQANNIGLQSSPEHADAPGKERALPCGCSVSLYVLDDTTR